MNSHRAPTLESTRAARVVDLARPGSAPARRRHIVSVPIAALLPGDSPRRAGADTEHVARLAELDIALPPILVHRGSMRVIDGMHRLLAASLRGEPSIDVEFFEGTAEEAFLRAVEANVEHGLPLTHEDRRSATERIIRSHPQLSDRAIALTSGLSAKSVAAIRRGLADLADGVPQPTARIGRDGKIHPLNNAEGRERAAELIAEFPRASLREIARKAGISPATVSDVRKRLASGLSPVPEPKPKVRAVGEDEQDDQIHPFVDAADGPDARPALRSVRLVADPVSLIEKLLRDPSLRHKDDGRVLLRLLQRNAIERQGISKLAAAVPSHCAEVVADLARQYAEMWLEFVRELAGRDSTDEVDGVRTGTG